MKRPAFFEAARLPLAMRLVLLPLTALSILYAAVAGARRFLHERGRLTRVRLSCPVVSVGNLGVGGSGKTPTTAWLAAALHRRGHRVAIASRGYGRAGREPVEVVSDGRNLRSSAQRAGDEPLLLAAHAPGVPVLVGPRRDAVGLRAVSAFGTQVLVLDDGFQHHRLARDLDLVLVDGRFGFGNRHVLPRGPLREPPSVLSRAHAVGVIDGPLRPEDEALLARHAPSARRFTLRRRPKELRPLAGGPGEPAACLAGREVGMLSGIANPASFRATLTALGARVVAERSLPDHHRYRARDLEGLARESACWITTEKDALKILPAWTGRADVRVLAIEVAVDDAEALLDWIEARLRARPAGRDAALPQRLRQGAAVDRRSPGAV